MKNMLVNYVCFDRLTGEQDVVRQYLVENEDEAYLEFIGEMKLNEDLEINEVFIVENLTEEEIEEFLYC